MFTQEVYKRKRGESRRVVTFIVGYLINALLNLIWIAFEF
jgi:hypothetical protein